MAQAKTKLRSSGQLIIEHKGESLILTGLRAVFRPKTSTLLVADLHLGKEEVFSRAGLALPAGVSESNLQQLTHLIELYSPEQIMILGDLMHGSPYENDCWPRKFEHWLAQHSHVNVSVVLGNHDRHYSKLGLSINWYEQVYFDPPYVYSHQPIVHDSGYVLSGHLHPMYVLKRKSDKLRCPIFWFRQDYAVLPAFGTFTGGHNVSPDAADKVYLVGDNEIIDLPN